MKYLVHSLTNTDEIRSILRECVDQSRFTRKEIAKHLSKIYPQEGWSERSIDYLLTDSINISITKVNQILDFLFPQKEMSFTREQFYEYLDDMSERISELRRDFRKSVEGDKTIDDKELMLLQAHINMAQNIFLKFIELLTKAVNKRLV